MHNFHTFQHWTADWGSIPRHLNFFPSYPLIFRDFSATRQTTNWRRCVASQRKKLQSCWNEMARKKSENKFLDKRENVSATSRAPCSVLLHISSSLYSKTGDYPQVLHMQTTQYEKFPLRMQLDHTLGWEVSISTGWFVIVSCTNVSYAGFLCSRLMWKLFLSRSQQQAFPSRFATWGVQFVGWLHQRRSRGVGATLQHDQVSHWDSQVPSAMCKGRQGQWGWIPRQCERLHFQASPSPFRNRNSSFNRSRGCIHQGAIHDGSIFPYVHIVSFNFASMLAISHINRYWQWHVFTSEPMHHCLCNMYVQAKDNEVVFGGKFTSNGHEQENVKTQVRALVYFFMKKAVIITLTVEHWCDYWHLHCEQLKQLNQAWMHTNTFSTIFIHTCVYMHSHKEQEGYEFTYKAWSVVKSCFMPTMLQMSTQCDIFQFIGVCMTTCRRRSSTGRTCNGPALLFVE